MQPEKTLPEEREYLRRAAATLDVIMKKAVEPIGHDRRPVGKAARRKMKTKANDNDQKEL